MTAKKSFIFLLRIVFFLFSLYFIKDAFYKWDGYSFYMKFSEYLPDLSLAFILWTIISLIFGIVLWMVMFGLPKVIKIIYFEHIMTWFLFIVFLVIVKMTLLIKVPIRSLTGLNYTGLLAVGCILAALLVWFLRKYVDKILVVISERISPIIWLFAVLFILAVPFSLLGTNSDGSEALTHKNAPVATAGKNRPNIILITMDALTAEDMQVYGYNKPTTPFISEWAKGAVVFDKAYSSSNWTSPSIRSLMTGQRVWTHGLWYMNKRFSAKEYKENFPKLMGDNGYLVYAFVQNSYAHPETLGIKNAFLVKDTPYIFEIPRDWWFDKFASLFAKRAIAKEWIFEANPIAEFINRYQPDIYETLVPPDKVYNQFLEYISHTQHIDSAGNRPKPFFAWLHLYTPHDLYLPPKPYMGSLGDAEKFNTGKKQWGSGVLRGDMGEYPPERQPDLDILRKRYDEFILYCDEQFKLFMLRLEKTVDMSNTIVILSSDHGDNFSHCCWQGHGGPNLFETFVHIPLIIKLSGETKEKVIDMPVEHIDYAPTILELAGIPVPEWMEGRSFLPLLEGKFLETRPIFPMEFLKNRALGEPLTKGTVAVIDGDYKLIYYLENKEATLFNLRLDPNETQDIFDKESKTGQRLLKLIKDNLNEANKRITQTAK